MEIQVATAGEALIDLISGAYGRFEPCIGAAVYKLSRALARQGIETLYLNPLSRDRFGRQLAAGLLEDGVHLAAPEPVVKVTSLAVVSVNNDGHPDYASADLPWLAAQRDGGRKVVIDAKLRPSVMADLKRYRAHVLSNLQYAVASASICVQHRGCVPPSRAEVRAHIASRSTI